MFLLQFYWPTILTVIAAAIVSEFIVTSGRYRNWGKIMVGYNLLILGYTVGSFGPVIMFTNSYVQTATGLGYDPGYVNNLVSLSS